MSTANESNTTEDMKLTILGFIRVLSDESRTVEDRLTEHMHQLYGLARRCGATNDEFTECRNCPRDIALIGSKCGIRPQGCGAQSWKPRRYSSASDCVTDIATSYSIEPTEVR